MTATGSTGDRGYLGQVIGIFILYQLPAFGHFHVVVAVSAGGIIQTPAIIEIASINHIPFCMMAYGASYIPHFGFHFFHGFHSFILKFIHSYI